VAHDPLTDSRSKKKNAAGADENSAPACLQKHAVQPAIALNNLNNITLDARRIP
jgi:hypothetical protein